MALPIIGKIIGAVAGKGMDIIDKWVPDKDLATKLKHELDMALRQDDQEFRVLEAGIERDIYESHQKTVQAELHQNDLYTKRTRPKIATRSFYAGLAYVLLTSIPEAGIDLYYVLIMPWQFQWPVLMLMYSPALTYMGVRGFEKWKGGGVA